MIIFLYGEDTYRSRKKADELRRKFLKDVDPRGNSISVIDGSGAGLKEINEVFSSSSLFSPKRMVIINNIFSNQAKDIGEHLPGILKKIIKRKNDDIVIVFRDSVKEKDLKKKKLFQFLIKQKFVQNFKAFSNTETVSWIKKECEARGAKIKVQAATEMAAMFGSDLSRIENEIDKLVAYRQGKENKLISGVAGVSIDENDIKEMCSGNFEENIFALTDALGNRNKNLALGLFEKELDSGVAESYLMHMIIRQFKLLIRVKQAVEDGYTQRKTAGKLAVHPFVVQKCFSQIRNFSLDTLKYILNTLIRIDYEAKTGQSEIRKSLELLFSKM